MSNGAPHASGPATYRTLRELGSRAQRSYAAVREPDELLVTQRFVRVTTAGDPAPATSEGATPLDAEAMALLLRDARCLAKNEHANIARVMHAEVSPAPRRELTIATELLDGSTLADLLAAGGRARSDRMGPPVVLRILVDVLAGLGALHTLRDAIHLPLGAIHGELCPANIVVGEDGVTRIVNALRPRPVRVGSTSEAVGHAAPEARGEGGTSDPRSDVYAVGAILRETLAGAQVTPFAGLREVTARALSADPAPRYANAREMAAELEAIAGTQLASHAAVALCVTELTGARIRRRRATLVPAISGTRRRASDPSLRDSFDNEDDDDLPGPRGSSPEHGLEGGVMLRGMGRSLASSAPRGSFSPLGPRSSPTPAPTPGPSPSARLNESATAAARARAPSVSTLPTTGTPGDFVIPIDVTETLDESAPRRRGRVWAALAAATLLATLGAIVALRSVSLHAPDARPASAAAPPPAERLPPAFERASGTLEAPAIATTPAARSSASARRAPPAPPPSAKPKRSIYAPDGL